MNAFLKDNVFSNPKGWAQRNFGSPFNCGFGQCLTVLLGLMVLLMFLLVATRAEMPAVALVSFMIVIALVVIEMPLLLLRALHAYVVDAQTTQAKK